MINNLPPSPPKIIPSYLCKTNFKGYYKHKRSNVVINGNIDSVHKYISAKMKSMEITDLRNEVETLKHLVQKLLSGEQNR